LCTALSNSDEFIVTGTKNKLINIIKIETGDIICSIEEHQQAVTALALSSDDNILVSGIFTL
jgi:hypothetical protein